MITRCFFVFSCLQEKVYSGSHNAIHVWNATGTFKLEAEIPHGYGSVYSLAVTKKYLVVGKPHELHVCIIMCIS